MSAVSPTSHWRRSLVSRPIRTRMTRTVWRVMRTTLARSAFSTNRWNEGPLQVYSRSSSVVSFTQFSPTCGRIPLPALSLWPGRQPCRPRLVDGRRGGGPSSVALRSRNPPTGRRRCSPISSSRFSHGPLLCAISLELANRASPLQIQPAKTRPPPVPF